jgi:ABC-type transport system involved in multi-copper enzyme maturation permease subunit
MIRKLLHIEQIKLLNYNPFRITLGLYFVAFALGIIIYPAIDRQIPVISLSDVFRFPDVWMFLAWITEPYNVMLALVVIMITTKEFNNHTFKTQVVFGLSRTDLLLQKLISIVVLALFATLLVGMTSLSLGLIYSYKLTLKIALENSWIMGKYFLAAFSYMTMGLLMGLLIKNTALSLLTFLAVRTFVEPVLALILRESEVIWYFPFRTITRLTPVPNLIQLFQRRMENNEPIDESTLDLLPRGLSPGLNILMVIVFTSLALFFSYRLFQRKRLT